MTLFDIYIAQLVDPFRIGLMVALVLTAANTAATLNRWIPIALGIIFVAVLLPTTFTSPGAPEKSTAIAIGLLSNATILAVILAAQTAYLRVRR